MYAIRSYYAIKIIEKEFSRPIDELFSDFNKTPHAAASIAQVHFAKTLDGKEVAVKILRPQIENKFKKDLRLFYWVAKATEKLQPSSRRLKPRITSYNVCYTKLLRACHRLSSQENLQLANKPM